MMPSFLDLVSFNGKEMATGHSKELVSLASLVGVFIFYKGSHGSLLHQRVRVKLQPSNQALRVGEHS
jgi:hypothetical protein